MHRSGSARVLVTLVAVVSSLLGPAPQLASATGNDDGQRPPPTSVGDFYPEDNDLSDCLGLVERPGCGSESRGGWRQTAVFGLLVIGLGLIVWRIVVGVRRNRGIE